MIAIPSNYAFHAQRNGKIISSMKNFHVRTLPNIGKQVHTAPFCMPNIPLSGNSPSSLYAMLPGDPLVTGTLSQALVNAISLFNNIILAR